MNKFIREGIISRMVNAGLDGQKSYYMKNEDVQKQIKFLRNLLAKIKTYPSELNEFAKYIEFVIPNSAMTFGTDKKNYVTQFIAFASFLDSLLDEKQRPTILKNVKFTTIMNKFKLSLNEACTLAIAHSYLIDDDVEGVNFVRFVYGTPNSVAAVAYIKESIKEQCLANKSIAFLTYIHQYDYLRAHMLNRYHDLITHINLMTLIALEDEQNQLYKVNIHWDEFKRLFTAIVKYAIKGDNEIDALQINVKYALDTVVVSSAMKEVLIKALMQLAKSITAKKKKKEKEEKNKTNTSTSWVNSVSTRSLLVDNSISRAATEELVKAVDDKVEKLKSTANRKRKIKIRGGY